MSINALNATFTAGLINGPNQTLSPSGRTEYFAIFIVHTFQSEALTLYVYYMNKQSLDSTKTPVWCSNDDTCCHSHGSNISESATDGILI